MMQSKKSSSRSGRGWTKAAVFAPRKETDLNDDVLNDDDHDAAQRPTDPTDARGGFGHKMMEQFEALTKDGYTVLLGGEPEPAARRSMCRRPGDKTAAASWRCSACASVAGLRPALAAAPKSSGRRVLNWSVTGLTTTGERGDGGGLVVVTKCCFAAATPGSATSQSARAESSWSDASRSHSRSQLNVAGIEAAPPRRNCCEATCSSQSRRRSISKSAISRRELRFVKPCR